MTKQIKASLDEIVEAVFLSGNGRIHRSNIRTALEKFVVEESPKKGGEDEG